MFLKIRKGQFINLNRVDKIIISSNGICEIRFKMGQDTERLMFKTEDERQNFIEKKLKSIIE